MDPSQKDDGDETAKSDDMILGRNYRLGPELDKQEEIPRERNRKTLSVGTKIRERSSNICADYYPSGDPINAELQSNKRQQNALNMSFHPVVPRLLAATVSECLT